MYIIKPGENTNRGNGIMVCHTLQEIRRLIITGASDNDQYTSVEDKVKDEKKWTYII